MTDPSTLMRGIRLSLKASPAIRKKSTKEIWPNLLKCSTISDTNQAKALSSITLLSTTLCHFGFSRKNLTFGNIYHFYQLQTRSIQNATCKKILEATNKDLRENYLTPQKLLHAFSVLVDYRNLCAHGERLYCSKVGRSQDIPFNKLADNLRAILPAKEHKEFFIKIINLFNAYGSSLHVVTNESLLCDMGVRDRGRGLAVIPCSYNG